MTTVSVVTGGAGSMGAACALALAPTVDIVLLADLDDARLDSVAEHIESQTAARVCTQTGDLGDPDAVTELAARGRALGTLYSLVHAAGLSPSMAGWEDILRVDLVASARLLDAFLPHAEPGSVAVCVASIAGHLGAFEPDMDALLDNPLATDFERRFKTLIGGDPDPGSTYRLAKRGVLRLCERAAGPWGARGGRVVSVSPGLIDTSMGRLELQANPVKTWMAEQTPVGRGRSKGDSVLPGVPDDIAHAVAFLVSDRAAFISGCDIRVDGGLVATMNNPGMPVAARQTPANEGTQ